MKNNILLMTLEDAYLMHETFGIITNIKNNSIIFKSEI